MVIQHYMVVEISDAPRLKSLHRQQHENPGLGALGRNEGSHHLTQLHDCPFGRCRFLFRVDGDKELVLPEAQPARPVKATLSYLYGLSLLVVGKYPESVFRRAHMKDV